MGNGDHCAKHGAVAGRRPLLDSWHGLLSRLQGRKDSEHEQILVRVVFSLVILAYLTFAESTGSAPSPEAGRVAVLIGAWYVVGALVLLPHLLLFPAVHPRRRYAGMLLDLGSLPAAMAVGGAMTAPLYPLFLWVIFGMGFRYGARYLFAAAGLSVAGFALVIAVSPHWRAQPALSATLMLALIILPAYGFTLLNKVTDALRRAEDASRAKSRFLATMSHELRTPLNAIIGMADLLRGTRLDADQRDMVTTVQGSAQALLGLIDDVLDFSKIESGRVEIERVPFDLHALLVAVHDMLHHQAAAKGLWLRLSISPRAPYRLHGGAQALRQVLINLVANAIKFTDRGGVTVRVEGHAVDGEAALLQIEVIDTGIGIPEQAQARIFDSFTQVDGGATRRFGGTGLGLAIARELATAMGGAIGVRSSPDRGSCFRVTLPLARMPEGERRLHGRAVILGGHAAAGACARRIAAWGLDVVPAADAHAAALALRGAGDTPAAVVVVAQAIPGEAGRYRRLVTDLTARLPGGRPPAAVLIGGDGDGLAAAADEGAYVTAVPSTAGDGELFTALHAALARPEVCAGAAPVTPAGSVAAPAGPRSATATAGGDGRRILVAEDNRVNQKVIAGILGRAGHDIQLVGNGEEALDALDEGAFDIVLLDLHMPKMGGLEAAKLLRFTHLDRPQPCVVALTADATLETRRQCADAGIEHVLTKPVEAPRLLALIDRLMAQRSAPHHARTPPAASPGAADGATVLPFSAPYHGATPPVLDRSRLDMLRALDPAQEFVAEIVDEFLSDAGQLADDLAAAAERGDAISFRELAHALSSSAAHVGAVALTELCASWRGIGPGELAARHPQEAARLRREMERTRAALLAACSAAPGGRRA